jgi:hypothetical protein
MRRRGENVNERTAVTLFQRQAGTTRLGVVQYRGGELAIICNNEVIGMRRWRSGDVEACIEAYLRLARNDFDLNEAD